MAEQMREAVQAFEAVRKAQGLYGADWALYLVRQVKELLDEPWVREDLFHLLTGDIEARREAELANDRLGDVIAEATLAVPFTSRDPMDVWPAQYVSDWPEAAARPQDPR